MHAGFFDMVCTLDKYNCLSVCNFKQFLPCIFVVNDYNGNCWRENKAKPPAHSFLTFLFYYISINAVGAAGRMPGDLFTEC